MKSSDFYREGDYKEYYKILQFFMRICGLWPYQSFFTKYFFMMLTIFLCEGILFAQLMEIFENKNDLNEVIDCIPNTFISMLVGIEFLGLIFNSKNVRNSHFNNKCIILNYRMECTQLKKCIDTIADDWNYLSSNVEIELLKSFTVQGRKLAVIYISKIINDMITIDNNNKKNNNNSNNNNNNNNNNYILRKEK
ncbi:odorant receptor 13a-like isoform X1 [Vespula squamosa]|uniref:Odorant receptor 13a-like isoform X1 n=1 Tax=Vespula squamosa TaxID=30214 RepID=A0ABD2B3F9_VESSQ